MKQLVLLFLFMSTISSSALAQRRKKGERTIQFCGTRWQDTEKMKAGLQREIDFFRLMENDTIVDIGASSGSYNGAISAATSFTNLHFVLVDIDSSCLNQRKVTNMIGHYSILKGDKITNTFQLVNNTPDSLWLPANRYKKAWLLNVLHEIPDPDKMVKDINYILQQAGELVLLEITPTKRGELHGGCRMPLRSATEWKAIFDKNGFLFTEALEIKKNRGKTHLVMMRFVKA